VGIVVASQLGKAYGNYLETEKIQEACTRNNMILILDVSTALGLVPIQLDNWKVDAALFNTDNFVEGCAGIYLKDWT